MTTREHSRLLAEQAGAVTYSPPPMRAVRGYSLTFEQLERLIALAQAEAYEEAAKGLRERSMETYGVLMCEHEEAARWIEEIKDGK